MSDERPPQIWRKYRIGARVLYWGSNHKGKMSEGRVIARLDLPGYSVPHYVIETPTAIEPLLTIRSGFILEMRPAMSSDKALKDGIGAVGPSAARVAHKKDPQ